MTQAQLEGAIRNEIMEALTTALTERFQTDVMDVSNSELAMPVVDAEGNEKFAVIKISIPRGTRDGTPYDGYAAHEDWELDKADKADKAAKRKEKAERAEAERQRKREAKKTIKKLNTEGLTKLIHSPDPDEGA